jgi:hypothetical protein
LEFSFWNLELGLDLEKIEAREKGAKFERKARRRVRGLCGEADAPKSKKRERTAQKTFFIIFAN